MCWYIDRGNGQEHSDRRSSILRISPIYHWRKQLLIAVLPEQVARNWKRTYLRAREDFTRAEANGNLYNVCEYQ